MSYSVEQLSFNTLGDAKSDLLFVWAHGWGHSKRSFQPLAESLSSLGESIIVDLPGFGDSPQPTKTWGSADYAEFFSRFLNEKANGRKVIWVGHSFGGSVGVSLAANYPSSVSGLALVAAAGIRTERSFGQRLKTGFRVKLFKFLKKMFTLFRINTDPLYAKFGSADYKQSGSMRQILVKTLNEDLSELASEIKCPTAVIYGENDTATPPSVGRRYAELIEGSTLSVLPGQDHYTLIGTGRHHVAKRIKQLSEGL